MSEKHNTKDVRRAATVLLIEIVFLILLLAVVSLGIEYDILMYAYMNAYIILCVFLCVITAGLLPLKRQGRGVVKNAVIYSLPLGILLAVPGFFRGTDFHCNINVFAHFCAAITAGITVAFVHNRQKKRKKHR